MSNVLIPKIDTKEKMHVLTLQDEELGANMAEDLSKLLLPFLEEEVKNVVLNFVNVRVLDVAVAQQIIVVQQKFYDNKASLVSCQFSKEILKELENADILDEINHTPTESEAWDIVQMEEIERELFE